jgi:tRNA 2-thiocytidine biosynthesis protein TtcA
MTEEIAIEIQAKRLLQKISKKSGQTIFKHQLIEPDDRILVALSGGKDSYILLETLVDRLKHFRFHVELLAVHVHIPEAGYINDLDYMKKFCQDLNVPLVIKTISVDFTKNLKKAPCFICSWHRRKQIFNLTRELKCNKLAFGHHFDDAIQTFILNMVFHGSISSLPQKLKMFNGRIYLIRPLLEIEEALLGEYALMRGFPNEIKKCPFDKDTKRKKIARFIDDLTKLNRLAKKNIYRSMKKIYPEYLPV